MKRKHLLIPLAVFAVVLIVSAAGTGLSDSGKVFASAAAATAAVGDDDLQIEVLHTRFCRDAQRHGNTHCVQEIVGRVVSTGKNAGDFKIGECVGFSGLGTPCGECADCRTNRPEQCSHAGWVCEPGCEHAPQNCRGRVVLSHHRVVRLSAEELREPFSRLCGRQGQCLRLYCRDFTGEEFRNRSGHCGGRRGHHCR